MRKWPKDKKKAWHAWYDMKYRCRDNPGYKQYKDYAGRGIKVCDRWLESFDNFLEDLGLPPEGTSLDRIDNDGDYCPGNCKWSTRLEQENNKRTNIKLTYGGITLTLTEWARKLGVHKSTIIYRYRKGWSVEDIVTKPIDLLYSRRQRS